MQVPRANTNPALGSAPSGDAAATATGARAPQAAPGHDARPDSANGKAARLRPTDAAGERPPRTARASDLSTVGRAPPPMQPGAEIASAAKQEPASRLRLSAQAPIETLPRLDFERTLDTFYDSLGGWSPDDMALPAGADRDREQAAWHARTTDIRAVRVYLEIDATHVAYMFAGRPAGVMSFSRPGDHLATDDDSDEESHDDGPPYLEVLGLATHPGSAGAGGALIEHAVNVSQEDDAQGLVILHSMPAAIGAYEAMGFDNVCHGFMQLDPLRSDRWTRQDGRWRLADHAESAYADGFVEPRAPEGEQPG